MPRPTYVNANVERANYNSSGPIAWNNLGGDWWDAAYTANGSTPWASQTVVDTDTVRQINFDVTTLFQAIYDNPNHTSAIIICAPSGSVGTEWAMYNNTTASYRPVISYDGGSDVSITEDTAIAFDSFAGGPNDATSSVWANLGTTTYRRIILNVPPPITRPVSATLKLTTVAQFGDITNQVFWLRYPPESAPSAVTYTYSRPASDITTQWTPSTGFDHYALIDETTANDADYIYATAAGQTDEVKLASMTAPQSGTDLLINYRVQGIVGSATVTLSLVCNTTVHATDTTRTANGDYTLTVPSGTWASVADWTNMRLRFVSA